MRVLLSAYACEPGKGSEPEVGWQWAQHLSRLCEVTVLTRANNEESIKAVPGSGPVDFLFHDLNQTALRLKRVTRSHRLYYDLWQRSASRLVRSKLKDASFDLAHHLTFASFRYPTAILNSGVPTIWGPVGGAEAIPANLLPWRHPAHLGHELARNASNALEVVLSKAREGRWKKYTRVLASTRETLELFRSHGVNATLFPTVGIGRNEIPEPEPRSISSGPLKLLFVGNLLYLKGVHFAIEALARSGTAAELCIVGDGPFRGACEHLAGALGLNERIRFVGRIPKAQVAGFLRTHDLFVFPSLHDSGGIAALEAMAAERPVIALDCGGPAVALTEGCGIKVPVTTHARIVEGITTAIQFYDSHREKLAEHGAVARQRVLAEYLWDRKAEQMVQVYREAVGSAIG